MKKAIYSFAGLNSEAEWSTMNGELGIEVFVVDNHSSDGSMEYLEPLFPFVQFIHSKENTGFAKANNHAFRLTQGEYILFLNPDTILPEDFFLKCIPLMEANPRIGAMGVQMIDGKGRFLKESKRGLPTSWASFCKLSGLTALFPHSKLFAKYYLGHLSINTNHEIEALSGACMLVAKQVLDKTGGFDERFFMYAEDIDLSFRIRQSGYKNFYLADTTVIHFKGESTTKDLRSVKLFYTAMIQFVEKHYTGTKDRLYSKFLKQAIRLRALIAFGNLHLPKRTKKHSAQRPKIFFTGDDCSIREIKISYADTATFVQYHSEADEIILCEGKDFPFSKIIGAMKGSTGRNYKIHALKSSGVVGG